MARERIQWTAVVERAREIVDGYAPLKVTLRQVRLLRTGGGPDVRQRCGGGTAGSKYRSANGPRAGRRAQFDVRARRIPTARPAMLAGANPWDLDALFAAGLVGVLDGIAADIARRGIEA
ncbi:hypothetical protein [Streptomyces sp. NPDC059604]|uniref:hypothetical protein n=1 Tax=Streptomyces sp. NPDC059604 TaxID=3346881 RepID=UPI0036BCD14F